ncbi:MULTISPECIES: Shedu immune nuclease family protein [unclassified Rhizobium]|uniref:Shedu immune nuclease family protein n=1 Tax=unclassified Rhizobium TaxID=2613769 RepID=UPI001AEAEFF9|nr:MULTISPECIES: Shedu immune nuclease family protein [unclassified Rhizobium]MBP2463936.1 hypothetical protein [Rhizobium sp. PvP014]MBP2532302.1 hypothetical protein [Rhizobium sp. PvP099]
MYLPENNKVVGEFERLLESDPKPGRQKEQEIQDFLEDNSELIITNSRLGYKLHMHAVISKYPLSTDLKTDFVYIVKTSGEWEITFVELEDPRKPIFTENMKRTLPSAQLTAALAQVRDWKVFVEQSRSQLLDGLAPILKPRLFEPSPTTFRYQLIYGRSADKNLTEDRKRHFLQIREEQGVDLFTYDQLIEIYRGYQRSRKNIMRKTKRMFAFKSLIDEPHHIFSHLGPGAIELTSDQEGRLVSQGYEMDAWKAGHLLNYNHRHPIHRRDDKLLLRS